MKNETTYCRLSSYGWIEMHIVLLLLSSDTAQIDRGYFLFHD